MKSRRLLHKAVNYLMIVQTLLWPIVQPLHLTAADFYWDTDTSDVGNNINGTNLGGNGTWDTAALNWWPVPAGPLTTYTNTANDRAIFSGPYPSPINNNYTVNVSSGINANGLSFLRNGYTLNGGGVTLTGLAPSIAVNFGETVVINSQILGTAGLTKTGGGALRLGNALNSYTGTTSISGGSVIINNQSALGSDTSTIVVSGSATRGLGGGSLVLEGGSGSGVTLSRNLSLQGFGPIADRSGALTSVRDNTVSGAIAAGVGAVNTRITSTGGRLTVSGGLDVGGTALTTITQFGGANTSGAGSYLLTGPLSGVGILEKSGSGTLLLSPSDTTGFGGTLRLSSSAAGTTSTVRIASANVLGTRTATTTGSVLDFNGGTLEVRMDTPSVMTGTTNANVYHRAGTSNLFVDHSVGGSAINQTLTLGAFAFEESLTFNFNGRNGYGVTLGAAPVQGGTGNSIINNNMNGNLTFTGAFWSNTDNTGNRTMTIGGTGNTILGGNLNATAAAVNHSLIKTGAGTLTITSTAGTIDGSITVNQGTLAITDFRSLNPLLDFSASPANGTINLGSTTNSATLATGTTTASTAAGLAIGNRTINLAGTTGGAVINANHAAAQPIQINTTISARGVGNKTLTLGGTSTQSNVINGAIQDNAAVTGVTSVVKADAGTWVLAGANSYTGNTTVTAGILELRATAGASNILPNANSIVFDTNAATMTAGGILQFRGVANTTTSETLGVLNANNGAGTVRIIGTGTGPASLLFFGVAPEGKGSGLNFDTSTGVNGTITVNGLATTTATTLPGNGHFYINGADFARSNAGVIVAPAYGTDSGFVNTTTTLIADSHNLVTANIDAQPAVSVTSLKMTANTLDLAGLLSVNTGGVTNDGGILVTGNSTISGTGGISTGGSGTLVYRTDVAASALFLNTTMTSLTTGGFTKNGAGSLVLSAANDQSGDITINEGTVRLSGNGTLGSANSPLIVRQGGTLDIGGVNTGLAIGSFNGAGTITNTGANATITVGGGDGTGIFSGLIRDGAGNPNVTNVTSITKVGAGAQTWIGNNNYTGVTTIGSTGLVSVTNLGNYTSASSIGRGNSTSNAASLVFNGSTGGLSYIGVNSTLSDRLFTLNGNGTNAGGQIANNSSNQSALIYSNTDAIAFGTNATVPQTLTLGGSSTGDSLFNPQITDNGALPTSVSKIGTGQWILGGNNTYTGTTTVEQGILIARDGQGLSNNSPLLLGSGAQSGIFQSAGNFTRNVSATPGPNTVTWNGSLNGSGGFAASEDKLVVALGGLVSPTPLTWGANGFVGTNNSTQVLMLSSATALGEVEFRNGINLGTETRTIQVNDNTNTATDFATMTGVLSGSVGGNLTKTGGGILQLFGDNSYVGNTNVTAGTLVVTSLGNSAVAGSSSVGANVGANTAAQALTLGNGSNTGGILDYVGKGEISDRSIRLNTTTAASQIHANGSGPLVLTNVANDLITASDSSKVLNLRGTNTAGNMITSNLTDGIGSNSTLGITVDGSATWILTGSNTYSGTTAVNAGALGIGSANSIGSGNLTLSSGNVAAYGADLAVTNPVQLVNNTTNAVTGDYNFTVVNPLQNLATANNNVLTNGIVSGKALILNDVTSNVITDNRTLTFNGTGDTIINGNITTSTPFNVAVTYSGNGSLTLNGTGSVLNNGALTISSGTVRMGTNEVIPDGTFTNNVVINPAANVTARLDLRGFNETINGLTATSAGNTIIDNSAPGSNSTLAIGGSNQNSNIGGALGANYTIQNSGAGSKLNLTKIGTGSATINPGVALTYTGATSVTGGGRLTVLSPLNGTPTLNVSGANSTLTISGGFTNTGSIKSINVGDGSTFSLVDNIGTTLGNLTSLTLGSPSGTNTNLNFNVGDLTSVGDQLNTDRLGLVAGGTLTQFFGNTVTLTATDTGLNANQSYVLLDSASGGLTVSNFVLAPVGGFVGATLGTSTANQIILSVGAFVSGPSYFTGTTDTTWNANVNNWADDKTGGPAAMVVPGKGTDVIFNADTVSASDLATRLEQNFLVNSLKFEASSTTPNSILIAPGANVSNRLEVAPASSALGIDVATGAPANVTISAPLRVTKDQTWNVTDATSALTLSGGVQGAGLDIIKSGAGRVTLSVAADNLFNLANTADVTLNGGTLEFLNAGALGSANNLNLARIAVNSGAAFYYTNATSGTIANNITLNGGTLSAGGNAQTYSGAINLSGNSSVVQRNQNAVAVNATTRAITLSGVISGAGRMTVDGNNALTAGNAIGPNLTISGNNTNWSGGIEMLRGTVIATTPTGAGTGSHTFAGVAGFFNGNTTIGGGRIILRGVDGNVSNYSNGLNFNSETIGEYQIDNVGALADEFIVNHSATVNLGTFGGNGTGAIARFNMQDAASSLNLNGGIMLNGNSSLGSIGGDADSYLTIAGPGIRETGGSYNLAINNERALWAVTSTRVAIDSAGNYTGGTSLNEGTLILGNKNALGTGLFSITAASTLQGSVDLSAAGTGAFPNAVQLGANLTVSGNNAITFANSLTLTPATRTLTNSIATNATLTLDGPVYLSTNALNGNLTLAGTAPTTFNGSIQDSNLTGASLGNVTITNTNMTMFNGNNTYTGTTVMNAAAGVLLLNGSNSSAGNTTLTNGRLQFNNAANSGLASGQLTLTTGTLEPLNAARTISNNATIGGTISVNGTQNLTFLGNMTQLGGNRQFVNNLTNSTLLLTTMNLSDSANRTLTIAGNGTTQITTLNNSFANSTLTSNVGPTGALNIGRVFLSESATQGHNLTIGGTGNTTITGAIADFDGVGLAGNLVKAGNGTLFLTQSSTYTGTTTQSGGGTQGVIVASANNALGTGNVTLGFNTGATSGQLQLTGGITLGNGVVTTSGAGNDGLGMSGIIRSVSGNNILNGNVSLTGGGGSSTYRADAGATLTFNGFLGAISNSTRDINLVGDGNFAFNGVIRDSNNSPVQTADRINLTKLGNGTTSLNGSTANTYTGVTMVSEGTLVLNKAAGVDAIAGNGTLSKVTPLVVVNGGTLMLAANDQINDSVSARVTNGTLNFNDKNEKIYNLDVSGGAVNYGTGNVAIDGSTWSGGANTMSGNTTIGTLDISGGTNTVNGTSTGGAGSLTIGTASDPGPIVFSGANTSPALILKSDNATPGAFKFVAGQTVDLNFTGTGTAAGLITSDGSGANAGRVDLNGSTRTFNIGDATGSAYDMTIAAMIVDSAGSSGIVKNGNGTMVLSAVNTYGGATTVSFGTLLINGSTAAGAVTVASGATLGGIGNVGGAATISGTLSPGNGSGVGSPLSFASSLSLVPNSTFTWELLSNTDTGANRGVAGVGYDGVNVNGQLSIDPTASSALAFNTAGSTVDFAQPFWLANHTWTVFNGIVVPTGVFGSLVASNDSIGNSATTLPGVFTWSTNGNNVVLNYTALAIPEPSSVLLSIFGLLGIGLRRSRKNRKTPNVS